MTNEFAARTECEHARFTAYQGVKDDAPVYVLECLHCGHTIVCDEMDGWI